MNDIARRTNTAKRRAKEVNIVKENDKAIDQGRVYSLNSQKAIRSEINAQVEEFLKNGGTIREITSSH